MAERSSDTWLIVGLGNPGREYEHTRHNAGFRALDILAQKLGCKPDKLKYQGLYCQVNYQGKKLLLLKPQTFMNLSGRSVAPLAAFFKVPASRIIVMFDDISLPVGTIRVRRSGSAGGQKGMASIIQLCGSDKFPRVKVGVGEKPHPDYDLAAWVLSKFTKEEAPLVADAARRAAEAAALIVEDSVDAAMNRFSR